MRKYHNLPQYKWLRKKLRNNMTPAERMLWKYLKNKQLGYKFRRQFGIGKYIVDFYCHELKLIVEVDGCSHDDPDVRKNDMIRQQHLESLGFRVWRYYNNHVYDGAWEVSQDIKRRCDFDSVSLYENK